MYAIAKRECIQLLIGVKSIIIIVLLLATAYYSGKYADSWISVMEIEGTSEEAKSIHYAGVSVFFLLLGPLFVTTLSHDSINRELQNRTMRFLVTKTSKSSILLGKFLGGWMFWFICLTVSYLLIRFFSETLDVFLFFQNLSLLTYQVAFTILLSVWISKPSLTMFLSIVIGIMTPVFALWSFASSHWLSWINVITPFYYLYRDDYTFIVIYLLTAIILYLAYWLFKRREF
ncbi:ABC transporter permease subunit [Bacillus carboniphilus]|uniref:ABC transporter permease subunit n=1 Tax=Bacillus carboniphilus TaxID=86663 RepID=A0ABY9JRP1_9BACI|nr:ABC transporter permease subunit [Bacillus carboniphilus]WLR42056.1 ABC transporter permease subunit [Bacillus carboniphilus]